MITFVGKVDERREGNEVMELRKREGGGVVWCVLCEFIDCIDSRQRKTVIHQEEVMQINFSQAL